MGDKNTGAKQAQKHGDCFNHLTSPFYCYALLLLSGTRDSRRLFHDCFVNPVKWFRAAVAC
jgi:hypothetical protein